MTKAVVARIVAKTPETILLAIGGLGTLAGIEKAGILLFLGMLVVFSKLGVRLFLAYAL